jgi:hypothetical protein
MPTFTNSSRTIAGVSGGADEKNDDWEYNMGCFIGKEDVWFSSNQKS